MALKLFNPGAATTQAKERKDKDNARIVEIQELVAKKLRDLADVEKQFDDTFQRQRNQWAAEEQEHQNVMLEKTKKVEQLEERRKASLVPLTVRGKELENVASALTLREERAAKRDKELNEKSALLEHRLDEVGEREQQCKTRETTIKSQEIGIQMQAQDLLKGSELLNGAIVKAQADDKKAKEGLDTHEKILWSRESVIGERERKVAEMEASFVNREKAIRDKYATLERTIKRLHGTSTT